MLSGLSASFASPSPPPSKSQSSDAAASWRMFDAAVVKCDKSVAASEELVTNGARALWVSYHNPPPHKIDNNEWLDSDRYWQAFVEKHHLQSPYQPAEDPESTAEIDRVKNSWHYRVSRFNDRSDTPMLYCYMKELPSWEYYDIHRRAFLEHMSYFLMRTGGDYRFFPEIPPWQWLVHIEELRYKFLSVAERRRRASQLSSLQREVPLDVQPVDVEHDGEAFHVRLLQDEASAVEWQVSRLMGSFIFLAPLEFSPVTSASSLVTATAADGGQGKLFSLGDDVACLFYLPKQSDPNSNSSFADTTYNENTIVTPKNALHNFMDHLTMTGRKLNPGYATMLDIMTDVMNQRGGNWLCGTGENLGTAFLRRLREDDPRRSVFSTYVSELSERFAAKVEIPNDNWRTAIEAVEARQVSLNELYVHLKAAQQPDVAAASRDGLERLSHLQETQQVQQLLLSGELLAVRPPQSSLQMAGPSSSVDTQKKETSMKPPTILSRRVTDEREIFLDITHFNHQRESIVEQLKLVKFMQPAASPAGK
eukprot:GHVT01069811.1.p1 GENE.GHVT01069811.1~~GHVT01069811.1.p1  ORF type:complete len:536 (+),score=79.16 GHVT01069811.1:1248-2855(+)